MVTRKAIVASVQGWLGGAVEPENVVVVFRVR
jgi:hypothetical protein